MREIYQAKNRTKSYVKNSTKKIKDKDNLKIFEEFMDEYSNENNLSELRIGKYHFVLGNLIAEYKGKLQNPTTKDFHSIVKTIKGLTIAENSKADRVVMLKTFYKWFKDKYRKKLTEENQDALYWLLDKGGKGYNYKIDKNKVPEKDLFSEQDCKRLITSTTSNRDKAIISMFWELGIRVGELLNLKVSDVTPYENGFNINVRVSKTQKRKLPFINGSPYLQTYLQEHPTKSDKNSYLWVSNKVHRKDNPHPPLSYDALMRHFQRLTKVTGIKTHPHRFRHTCATRKASLGWNEAQMNSWFGWSMNTRMAGVYIHKSGIDMRRIQEESLGIKKEKTVKDETLKPITCKNCNTINEVTNMFCKTCHNQMNELPKEEVLNKDDYKTILETLMKQMNGLQNEVTELRKK